MFAGIVVDPMAGFLTRCSRSDGGARVALLALKIVQFSPVASKDNNTVGGKRWREGVTPLPLKVDAPYSLR